MKAAIGILEKRMDAFYNRETTKKEDLLGENQIVNRKYKDTVFTDLFYSDESALDNLLELTNAILGTQYKSSNVIKKVRLEDALLIGQKNDVAYTVEDTQIILCEHQSTINYNMPVRLLQYIAKEYEQYISSTYGSNAKYRKEQLVLPEPRFFVFYNGEEDQPIEYVMRLSDAYMGNHGFPELELSVRIININHSANHKILQECNILRQYSQMVELVSIYLKQDPSVTTAKQVAAAIRVCIQNEILRNYLLRKESEVVSMLSAEYSYEADMKVQRDEAEKRGEKIGEKKGERNTLFSLVKDKLLDNKEAARRLDITMEQFQDSYNEWLEENSVKATRDRY